MTLISLTDLPKGGTGIICRIDLTLLPTKLQNEQSEMYLLNMGFNIGAKVTVLHFGLLGHDPIALRINNSSNGLAIRRNYAKAILLEA